MPNAVANSTTSSEASSLVEEHERNLAFIESIKQSVSQEWDNIHNPVPFMQVPVYEEIVEK